MRQYTKEELVLAARAKGWHGNRGSTTKTQFVEWLTARGVREDEVVSLGKALLTPGAKSASETIEREDIADIVRNVLSESDAVTKAVQDVLAAANPQKLVVTNAVPSGVKMDGTHPLFEKVLRLIEAGLNVLLVGPAGCGKTTLAHHLSDALKAKFGMLSLSGGTSESQLVGWLLPVGDSGRFKYVPSEFVRLYEEGNSVFLFDELDGADSNMLLVANSAFANGSLHIPQRYENPLIKRGKHVRLIAAANTFGTGADIMYAGRNQLDAATLDRFYTVKMDYDRALEDRVVGRVTRSPQTWTAAKAPTQNELEDLARWIDELRTNAARHNLRRVVGTRSYIKAMSARKAGVPTTEVKADLLNGWTRDELAKVGVN